MNLNLINEFSTELWCDNYNHQSMINIVTEIDL